MPHVCVDFDVSRKSPAASRIMFEKLITCSEAVPAQQGRNHFCVKIVGYEKQSNENITARGCTSVRNTIIPDRYDSKNIQFGKYKIRGSLWFCDSIGCNGQTGWHPDNRFTTMAAVLFSCLLAGLIAVL